MLSIAGQTAGPKVPKLFRTLMGGGGCFRLKKSKIIFSEHFFHYFFNGQHWVLQLMYNIHNCI